MPTQPKHQKYQPLTRNQSATIDCSFLSLRPGTFVHLDAGEDAVEIRMDDDGNIGVCISSGVVVNTFAEVYG